MRSGISDDVLAQLLEVWAAGLDCPPSCLPESVDCSQTCSQGLSTMQAQPVVGPLLAAAGMRTFHGLIDRANAAQDWPAAEALHRQVGPIAGAGAREQGSS